MNNQKLLLFVVAGLHFSISGMEFEEKLQEGTQRNIFIKAAAATLIAGGLTAGCADPDYGFLPKSLKIVVRGSIAGGLVAGIAYWTSPEIRAWRAERSMLAYEKSGLFTIVRDENKREENIQEQYAQAPFPHVAAFNDLQKQSKDFNEIEELFDKAERDMPLYKPICDRKRIILAGYQQETKHAMIAVKNDPRWNGEYQGFNVEKSRDALERNAKANEMNAIANVVNATKSK